MRESRAKTGVAGSERQDRASDTDGHLSIAKNNKRRNTKEWRITEKKLDKGTANHQRSWNKQHIESLREQMDGESI